MLTLRLMSPLEVDRPAFQLFVFARHVLPCGYCSAYCPESMKKTLTYIIRDLTLPLRPYFNKKKPF